RSGIYRIYSLIDDRCYIGSSRNLYRRVNSHLNELSKGTHSNSKLQRFVNKYGIDNLKVEVICLCKQRELCDLEDENRVKYKSFTKGFDLMEKSYRPIAYKHSKRSKRNMSKAQKRNL